jgi:PEP-CTERM motif
MKGVNVKLGLSALAAITAAGLASFSSANAAVVTYDVNMNFNPTVTEAPPGPGSVGTITGTVTYDNSSNALVAVDLTEATNDGLANIGGGFGSPTYTSIAFTETQPDVITFFGSPDPLPTSGSHVEQISGQPYLALFFQTSASVLDGTLIGPSFQFDFPEAGGAVIPGNFDSITSETKYLYGDVTVAGPGAPGAPEPATWVMMALGFGAMGYALRRRQGLAAA